jgi:hypothetical protein
MVVTALPELASIFAQRIPYITKREAGQDISILEMHPFILDELAEEENGDPFISIAARFFHKLHGCGELNAD